MKIKFSSKYIKLEFEFGEPFSGQVIRMKGEPLTNGFDADLASAEWLGDRAGESINPRDLLIVKQAIELNNSKDTFRIVFMGE